jgi:hypothetical protein
MEDEPKRRVPPRPIRPFLTGLAVAAGWGAVNVPGDPSAGALGELIAMIAAITLVAGGALAMAIELVKLAARLSRERLRT